ncbi:hypothetical protein GUJ93_ZPchr0007g3993 [Zizania palustris]|nr:hypothetical protein GUJ93_ZPchr0007g3993 [Zizania palustris]
MLSPIDPAQYAIHPPSADLRWPLPRKRPTRPHAKSPPAAAEAANPATREVSTCLPALIPSHWIRAPQMIRVIHDSGEGMQKEALAMVSSDVNFPKGHFPDYKIGPNNQIIDPEETQEVVPFKEIVVKETAQLLEQRRRLSVRDLKEKFEKGLFGASKLSEEAKRRETASLDRQVLLKKLRDVLDTLKGCVAGRNRDDADEAMSLVEALAVQLTQREGELIYEKAEVKKLASFLKQYVQFLMATEDARKVAEEERALALGEIEKARAAVAKVKKGLQEHDVSSSSREEEEIEELRKEVREARRMKMLHQPSNLCGSPRGGGNAAAKAVFWQARKGLSYTLAFETDRDRNAAIMLARKFASNCNITLTELAGVAVAVLAGGKEGSRAARLHSFFASVLSGLFGQDVGEEGMATRNQNAVAAPQLQNRGNVAALGKQKAAVAGRPDAKNRRALGDIGNVVNVRLPEGKPLQQAPVGRPVTRNFGAQLLKNAQANAAANKQKAIAPAAVARPAPRQARKAPVKPAPPPPEHVIEISSDSDESMKQQSEGSASSVRKCSRRKVINTLTSVLTARSKVACGITDKPRQVIEDIDKLDGDNELAVVDYIEDIYKFYKVAENECRPCDYVDSQVEINSKMRAILADWMIEVHHKFELMPETLYLAMYVVDRYLSMQPVLRRELQLVGVSAMLIACKYEEIWAPEVNDFILISDSAYTREQILSMEKGILNRLQWNLTVPTLYVFIVRYLKAAASADIKSDKEMEHMAFFFAELALMQYGLVTSLPSMVAASAVYAARLTLKKSLLWTDTLKHHTGFTEPQLM